jgi:hypothetical protein
VPPAEGYHESITNRDSNMGRDALGARTPGCCPLVYPSLSIPNSKCPRAAVEPTMGHRSVYNFIYHSYLPRPMIGPWSRNALKPYMVAG